MSLSITRICSTLSADVHAQVYIITCPLSGKEKGRGGGSLCTELIMHGSGQRGVRRWSGAQDWAGCTDQPVTCPLSILEGVPPSRRTGKRHVRPRPRASLRLECICIHTVAHGLYVSIHTVAHGLRAYIECKYRH
jgi:hypothetical protein